MSPGGAAQTGRWARTPLSAAGRPAPLPMRSSRSPACLLTHFLHHLHSPRSAHHPEDQWSLCTGDSLVTAPRQGGKEGGKVGTVCWCGLAWIQASTSSKSSFWWSSRNLVKVLMGLMAFRVMATSLAHSRFGPNTTARLVFVILFLSL